MNDKQKQQTQKASGGGISFCGLLAIVFITLKLLGKIAWSWWWVLSPIWIPLVIIFGTFLVVLIAGAIVTAIAS